VAVTVGPQRDEVLQALQTQPQVSPPVGDHREQRERERDIEERGRETHDK